MRSHIGNQSPFYPLTSHALTKPSKSSLSTSFAPPSLAKPPAPPASTMAAIADASVVPEPSSDAEAERTVPGMAEWKDTYESYVEGWTSESAEARKKAEETRLRIEGEREAERKAEEERVKGAKRAEKEREEEEKRAEKLRRELAGGQGSGAGGAGSSTTGGGGSARQKKQSEKEKREERERKVREAWEMVKGAGEGKDREEVVVDARGVMPEDLAAGQALSPGQTRPHAHPVSCIKLRSLGLLPKTSVSAMRMYAPHLRPPHPSPVQPLLKISPH